MENGGLKAVLLSGPLEDSNEERFVISFFFFCGLSIAAPLMLFFTAFWEEGMALEVVLLE